MFGFTPSSAKGTSGFFFFFDIVQTILRSLQSWQPEPKGKAVAVGQARIRLAVE